MLEYFKDFLMIFWFDVDVVVVYGELLVVFGFVLVCYLFGLYVYVWWMVWVMEFECVV